MWWLKEILSIHMKSLPGINLNSLSHNLFTINEVVLKFSVSDFLNGDGPLVEIDCIECLKTKKD